MRKKKSAKLWTQKKRIAIINFQIASQDIRFSFRNFEMLEWISTDAPLIHSRLFFSLLFFGLLEHAKRS